jgi:hypothetical protein
MLLFFPDPYPEELLYSVCARYQDRRGFQNKQRICLELFGVMNSKISVGLPNRIERLLAVLPTQNYKLDQFIEGHTLFPLYTAFVSPDRSNVTRKYMASEGNRVTVSAGAGRRHPVASNHLRFCIACAEKDLRSPGERYWHRIHQVHGVEVCPIHSLFLENSSTQSRKNGKVMEYISAEKGIDKRKPRPIKSRNRGEQILMKVARDVDWLLKHPNLSIGHEALGRRYTQLLGDRGLASKAGTIHVTNLIKLVSQYYPADILRLLNCELGLRPYTWLHRLAQPTKKARSPLLHLLLLQAMECTVEEFFRIPINYHPFGMGPWTCLNPACSRFNVACINQCEVTPNTSKDILIGIFGCECGFTYSRTYPARSSDETYKIRSILEYGLVWEAAFRQYWSDPTISLKEIGRRLGISDSDTIKGHAARLGQSFPREGPHGQVLCSTTMGAPKEKPIKEIDEEVLVQYRNEWLSALQENPRESRSKLKSDFGRVRSWLNRHDKEWFADHQPPARKRMESITASEWEAIDQEIVEQVRQAAVQIKNKSGPPVRVTKHSIEKLIRRPAIFRTRGRYLPGSLNALGEVVETYDAYAIRRLIWKAQITQNE